MLLRTIILLVAAHYAFANRGTNVKITNNTPWLLRLNRMWSTPGKKNFSPDNISFLPPNASVTYQGHTNGFGDIGNSVDVAFFLERFCFQGASGKAYSLLGDSYVGTASFIVDNPAIGYPYIRMYTRCKNLPYDYPHKACGFTDVWSFDEGELKEDVGFTLDDNTMRAKARRGSDSPDNKEFEMWITVPPKACVRGMDCATDWRANVCNAQ